MNNIESLRQFLAERPEISINSLEETAGLSQKTLYWAVQGKRKLSKKAWEKLLPRLIKLGYTEYPVSDTASTFQ